jgi:hypothetical protein
MFGQNTPMQIEKNVATIQRDADDYRIVVTVERRGSEAITQQEAERVLTKIVPLLFRQRITFGA